MALIIQSDESRPDLVVVEAKPANSDLKSASEQLNDYLKKYHASSHYTPYMGIVTDGMRWKLTVLGEDGKIRYRTINIQPLLRWGYLTYYGAEPPFPHNCYRAFNIFCKNNIKYYCNCLRDGKPLEVKYNNKSVKIEDLPKDPQILMDEVTASRIEVTLCSKL